MEIDISNGKYWDEGITLVDGCTPCSPGCDHCWAAAHAHRFYREGEPCHESGLFTDDSGRFNGDIVIHPERLTRFNTRNPKVFAIRNDLFHEKVPDDFILKTIQLMGSKFYNIYLIQTKQPKRMIDVIKSINPILRSEGRAPLGLLWDNVYFGLTICNQQEADEKIPIFLQVPGRKFLSIEPMLSDIILPFNGEFQDSDGCYEDMRHNIKSVILGGETGHGARPMNPAWVRSVRDQCAAAGVSFYFKSWGACCPVDIFGKDYGMLRVGRQRAGRRLDGRTHDALHWLML